MLFSNKKLFCGQKKKKEKLVIENIVIKYKCNYENGCKGIFDISSINYSSD